MSDKTTTQTQEQLESDAALGRLVREMPEGYVLHHKGNGKWECHHRINAGYAYGDKLSRELVAALRLAIEGGEVEG